MILDALFGLYYRQVSFLDRTRGAMVNRLCYLEQRLTLKKFVNAP